MTDVRIKLNIHTMLSRVPKTQHHSQLVSKAPVLSDTASVGESLSRVRLFATPWTIQSVEFPKPEYWSR